MKILYHITLSPPCIPGTDAVYQEVELLNNEYGSKIIRWYPFSTYTKFIPPFVFGVHNLIEIWKREQECDVHHIFHSIWYPFPLLSLLRKPVVFTVAGGLAHSLQYAPRKNIHLILPSEQEQQLAIKRGWKNTSVVYPGIDTGLLSSIPPLQKTDEFVLLAGSAPWEASKFTQKGFDLMLELVKNNANIRLITLWRGVLFEEWKDMISRYGVEDRVEVYNTWVDIATILPRVHAAIVLADRGGIVKAWPHSLLESLTAGRPVIISRAIPMADYVEKQGNGVVVENMEYEKLYAGVQALMNDYNKYQNYASKTRDFFSKERSLNEYEKLYTGIIANNRKIA